MEKRFIVVTSAYSGNKGDKLTLSVDGIGGMLIQNGSTLLKHITHIYGGYEVYETVDEILELIKKSKPI